MTRQFVLSPIWKPRGADAAGPAPSSVQLQAALEDCNKALQSGPNDAATYDSRGLIHLKMGQARRGYR